MKHCLALVPLNKLPTALLKTNFHTFCFHSHIEKVRFILRLLCSTENLQSTAADHEYALAGVKKGIFWWLRLLHRTPYDTSSIAVEKCEVFSRQLPISLTICNSFVGAQHTSQFFKFERLSVAVKNFQLIKLQDKLRKTKLKWWWTTSCLNFLESFNISFVAF